MQTPLQPLNMFSEAVTLATLAAAGFSDYKTREVDDKVWIAGGLAVTPFILFEIGSGLIQLPLYLLSLATAFLVIVISWRLRLVGEADLIALGFIAYAEPPSLRSPLTVTPLASIVVLAGLASAAYILYNVFYNIKAGLSFPESTPLYMKITLLVTARLVTPEEYKSKSYMFAPTNDSPQTQQDKVWATVYLPYTTLLAFGYFTYLLIKNILL